jgi:hypothetical protein
MSARNFWVPVPEDAVERAVVPAAGLAIGVVVAPVFFEDTAGLAATGGLVIAAIDLGVTAFALPVAVGMRGTMSVISIRCFRI